MRRRRRERQRQEAPVPLPSGTSTSGEPGTRPCMRMGGTTPVHACSQVATRLRHREAGKPRLVTATTGRNLPAPRGMDDRCVPRFAPQVSDR